MTMNETTPLLPPENDDISEDLHEERLPGFFRGALEHIFQIENRILFTGFLITLSFSFTQVPLFYVFHLMSCDVYWDEHGPWDGVGDRCSRDEIASSTALQYCILGMSTTFFGTLNLLLSGWTVRKIGPRAALMVQTIVPAIRALTQILGVAAGKSTGMLIIQLTQLITIVGGPAGYILVVNIIAGEIVLPQFRTALFGKLQGAIMLGQSLGFLAGGMIGDTWNIRAPFDTAFVAFLASSVWVRFALPYLHPSSIYDDDKAGGASGFLAPLKVLVPQKIRKKDGTVRKHYGVSFLAAGIFVGVLATGYAPHLIQMYATAAFGFSQSDNGWLMSEFSFMRSIFLLFMFPPIINLGRKLLSGAKETRKSSHGLERDDDDTCSNKTDDGLPTCPSDFDVSSLQGDTEPIKPVKGDVAGKNNFYKFDLVFLRWSLVIDGAMTTVAAFATKPWHIYLAAFLLPFGSGSAPAAKGVITQMTPESQRADALNAVTLIENVARLATQGTFGFVFASLASVGKAYATFFCNAAVAVLAMAVLLLSNFPEDGSQLVEDDTGETEGLLSQRDSDDETL